MDRNALDVRPDCRNDKLVEGEESSRTILRAPLISSLPPDIGPAANFGRNCVAYRDDLLGGLQGNILRLTEVGANEPRFCSRREYAPGIGDAVLENGFPWSEQLQRNSFWNEQALVWTPDVVPGPGGVRTAGQVVADATTTFHLVMIDLEPTSSHVHGYSIYAKALTQPYVGIASYDVSGTYVVGFFDAVTAQLVGQDGPLISAQSEVIGGGWIRVQIRYLGGIAQHTHLAFFHNSPSVTDESYLGDGATVDGYFWGAQHSYGTDDSGQEALPEYVATFGSTRRLGPRFNGLLVEDASENYCTGGSNSGSPTRFTAPEYVFSDCVSSATPVLCLDGVTRTTSMIAILPAAVDAYLLSYQACIAGQTNCVSLYVRSLTVPWMQLFIEGPNASVWFDLINRVVGTASGTALTRVGIEDVGAGWCYIYASVPNGGTIQGHYCAMRQADGGSNSIGLPAGDAMAVYGMQFERNRIYPSSLILTSGTSVTRLSDELSYSGLVVPPRRNVQLQAEALLPRRDEDVDRTLLALSDGGGSADQITLQVLAAGDAARTTSAATGGDAGEVTGVTDIIDGIAHRLRADCRHGSLRLRVDGSIEGAEDTVVTLPTGLDTLTLGPSGGLVRNVLVRSG